MAPAVRLTGKIGFDADHTRRVAAPIDGRVNNRILVKLGDKVRAVRLDVGAASQKVGRHVGDVLDPESRTIKVRCSVRNPGFRLKPEMFAEVALAETVDKKVIVIPSSAILTDAEHARIFVAGNDHIYRQRFVTVGRCSLTGLRSTCRESSFDLRPCDSPRHV